MINLGNFYLATSDFTKASHTFSEAVNLLMAKFGKGNPLTQTAKQGLGTCLSYEGRHVEAITVFTEICQNLQEVLGEDHPQVSSIRNSIALELRALGKYTHFALTEIEFVQL